MSEDDFTFKSQAVNYLGFLEAQLRDMQGIAILAYELIQNADDAQGENGRFSATTLSFNLTDEALIVENDGVFRDVDFARMQNLAGGGKREEADTTGAFGIGFIAVYQITDAPEIFSNNIHWTIRPDAAVKQRIQERQVQTEGTRFVLPWAFNPGSAARRALRMEAITPDNLDTFAERFAQAIEVAALFLQRLHTLTVKRNGRLLKQITRQQTADGHITLTDQIGNTRTWLLLQGNFDVDAGWLRSQYTWQIEPKRRSRVRLALPLADLDRTGRLFAVLPTATTMPLPAHLNADFYPTTDRKRIHFENGYQAEWNQAAVRCAARILAEHIERLPPLLGPAGVWQLIQRMDMTRRQAEAGDLPALFAAFWQAASPLLRELPIFYTANDSWVRPGSGRLLIRGGGETAVSLLKQLDIPIAHPDLTPFTELMRQPDIGTPLLTIQDMTDALRRHHMMQPMPLADAPPFLQSIEALQTVWQLVDSLLSRIFHPREIETALDLLHACALVLTDRMWLDRLDRVYDGRPETKALFPDVSWVHTAVSSDHFPGRYVQTFGVRQAVTLLSETPQDQLEASWRLGRLDVSALFRWFESQQIEIFADDPMLQQDIRRLPLVPVRGELRPLADLYLPGGFEDPLHLAGFVDIEAVGGRSQFLRDLGVSELDFMTYLHTQLPRALANSPDLPSDTRHRLLHLLAERLGEFRDDDALQAQLTGLPLIPTLDGVFRPAGQVYANRDVMTLLGENVHIAEPQERQAVVALYNWLGVRRQPASEDIVAKLKQISVQWGGGQTALDAPTRQIVQRCLQRLDDWLGTTEGRETAVVPLKNTPIIPNKQHILMLAGALVVPDQPKLVAKFGGLSGHLIDEAVQGARILPLLGVRPISQAAEELITTAAAEPEAGAIRRRFVERAHLIERVWAADPDAVRGKTVTLADLRILNCASLQRQFRLALTGEVLLTPARPVTAHWDAAQGTLFVQAQESIPWAGIAREVAALLKGGRSSGTLALGIREVLTAETAVLAQNTLDELGYP